MVVAVQVRRSPALATPGAVPIAAAPWGPAMLQVTVPAPSPVRTVAASTARPLRTVAGWTETTTGVLAAGTQVTVVVGAGAVAGVGKSAITL